MLYNQLPRCYKTGILGSLEKTTSQQAAWYHCHSVLDTASIRFFRIPASAGTTKLEKDSGMCPNWYSYNKTAILRER
jgi:hypothetical protein